MSLITSTVASIPAPADPLPGWLAQSSAGDEAAFALVYETTAARVHGLVLRVLRDSALAEEVTQEVYVDVWTQSGRFDARRGSATSWMMTIAHRRAVDRVRNTSASRRRDTADHQRTRYIPTDDTVTAAESSWQAGAVRSALAELAAPQRQALELAYFGGHTHAEVAVLLQIPLGTAKTRIRDGLLRLRAIATTAGLEHA